MRRKDGSFSHYSYEYINVRMSPNVKPPYPYPDISGDADYSMYAMHFHHRRRQRLLKLHQPNSILPANKNSRPRCYVSYASKFALCAPVRRAVDVCRCKAHVLYMYMYCTCVAQAWSLEYIICKVDRSNTASN